MNNQFTNVGVQEELPSNVIDTINPGDDIQSAIDDASDSGGGVVLLESGTYQIGNTIEFEDNVILRGVDQDSVVLNPTIRASEADTADVFNFEDDSNSGIENLTIDYTVPGLEPTIRNGLEDGGFCEECFENDPGGRDDLYVRQINVDDDSHNNLFDNLNIINSGTSPIQIEGNNNTLSNNVIDGAYNKGGGGEGYYDIRGDNNLIQNETITGIRHFAIQRGATGNLVTDSSFEVDINFHNDDGGNNLVEGNTIRLPSWFSGDPFNTGEARSGHEPPGPGNIIVNNDVQDFGFGADQVYVDNVVYTFEGFGDPVATNLAVPDSGSFL